MGWKKHYWEGIGAWFSKVDSMLQDFVDNKKGMMHQMGGESNLVEFHWKKWISLIFHWFNFFSKLNIFYVLGPKITKSCP
jgi:hypothetical protein